MACGAIGDFTESSVVDWTWTHPQSGVEYVCEYPFRRLDREADIREVSMRLRGWSAVMKSSPLE